MNYATTNQSSNLMPFQWVKISMKTKRLSGHDVDNAGLTTNQDVPVYYDGAEYLYSPPTINPTKTGYRVYQITAFAKGTYGRGLQASTRDQQSSTFSGPAGSFDPGWPNPEFWNTE